ncbi:MAG: hypothetical protein HFG08_09450 [Oscillibacter sp.]|nr:hypothetical protein [Oscillibacter sp.]
MELRLDLHVHSCRSPDGCMSLAEIVERARAAGLSGAAVCDHDLALTDPPVFPDFLLIPGVEVSTEYGHLLGLFVTGPVKAWSLRQAVDIIHGQGGLAVLAHPFERSRDAARLEPIVPLLDGAEVWNGRADRKIRQANALAEAFARAHGLRPFAGSDAHLPQEIGNGVTAVEAEALTLAAAKTALLAGEARISGRRSRAWYTARSQLNKRRKTGAGPGAYVKWGAFALKCLAQDLVIKPR